MKNIIDKSAKPLAHVSQSDVAYQMTMALSNLNGHYKNEIHSYAKELQEYILTIEKLKNDIKLHENILKPQEKKHNTFKHDVNYELRILERLNNTFIQDSKLLSELKSFLADSKHNERLVEKKTALQNLLLDINEIESNLLKKELEKQNVLLEMKPTLKKIEMLKYNLNKVELEKHFMESTKIHQITQQDQLKFLKKESNSEHKIIDTDISSEG